MQRNRRTPWRMRKLDKQVKLSATPYRIRIRASLNNTHATLSRLGKVLVAASTGSVGFKHGTKSTPYAGQSLGEHIEKKCLSLGIRKVRLILKGIGPGKEPCARAIFARKKIFCSIIRDVTSLPYNGCRAPNKRRL